MFKPTQDYVLVRPLPRFHSAIIDVQSQEKHARGKVLAVGPGKLNKRGHLIPLDVQVGNIVAFGDGAFDWFPVIRGENNETLRLIQEADIAFVEEEDHAPA